MNFVQSHADILIALAAYYVVSAAVGAMPAPTAVDGKMYNFWFKFLNTLGGNLTRAFNTIVEQSPNFQPAVNLQQKIAGQQETTVQVPPVVEKP